MNMEDLIKRWIAAIKQFFSSRFNRENEHFAYYLSILIAMVIFVLGMNAFVELAGELADNELTTFDSAVTDYVRSFISAPMTSFMRAVSFMGGRYAYPIIIIAFALILLWKRKPWRFTAELVFVTVLSAISNVLLKQYYGRSRPALEYLSQIHADSLSFPSGHSMGAMAFYGFLLYLSMRFVRKHWIKHLLAVVLVALILLIGISRIYLGVHYPSDVVAGFTAGLIWLAGCIIIFNFLHLLLRRRQAKALTKEHVPDVERIG